VTIRSFTALAAVVALLAATPAPKATSTPKPTSTPSALPSPSALPANADEAHVGVWTVRMTQLDVNFKTGNFSTPAHVEMLREGGDITGDRASGNFKTKDMTIYGHVIMHDTQGNFGGLSSTKPTHSRGPATLTADQVHIDGTAKVYTATGTVHYVQADTTTDADKGTLDDTSHDLDLVGNVHIVQGDRNMQADHVLYNTITGQSHAEGNPVTMQFPSDVHASVATPKPIKLRVPGQKKGTPEPSPTPSG
jgi:lipopolysaccharide assembly outer membrane protein LptD (OstA)